MPAGAESTGPAVIITFADGVNPVRNWISGANPFELWLKVMVTTRPLVGPPFNTTNPGM